MLWVKSGYTHMLFIEKVSKVTRAFVGDPTIVPVSPAQIKSELVLHQGQPRSCIFGPLLTRSTAGCKLNWLINRDPMMIVTAGLQLLTQGVENGILARAGNGISEVVDVAVAHAGNVELQKLHARRVEHVLSRSNPIVMQHLDPSKAVSLFLSDMCGKRLLEWCMQQTRDYAKTWHRIWCHQDMQ